MPLEHLHNFAALQIPHVYFVVLRAGDDPFATGDAEARKDTVHAIGVPRIRLEATGCVVIPQPDRVVERRGENIFAVRRELHVRAVGEHLSGRAAEA